jgi:hypothetical protein
MFAQYRFVYICNSASVLSNKSGAARDSTVWASLQGSKQAYHRLVLNRIRLLEEGGPMTTEERIAYLERSLQNERVHRFCTI